jgi:V8-like Glu-specific endopeptidase
MVTEIVIYPGRYKDQYSFDSIRLSGKVVCQNSIAVHPSFSWNRKNYDFGIIVIPDSLLKKTKNWPSKSCFSLDTAYELRGADTISVAGFPASNGYDGSLMTYEVQKCKAIQNKIFLHDFDTQTGNSGSPVWVENYGKRIIVGVHTYANTGTRIDKEYINLIMEWISQKTH